MFRASRDWMAKRGEILEPEPGSMYFGMVELEFALPWFHLRVEIKAEDGVYYTQVLPSGIEEFKCFMKWAGLDERALSVKAQVMLPMHMTGRDEWTLEPLVTLHEVTGADFKTDWFFTVASGAVFRYGDGATLALENALNPLLIYPRF
ncbi:hypothetical protein C5L43_20515 [Ectopseudomonas oleovorans]|nr:hypothetical protein C5L43_20515 [Pseudomonas oleovorans]